MIRAIAGKEIKTLWTSPSPYLVGALFHLTLGILFVNQIEGRRQALLQPLFPIAGFLLLALVPVLTMRLVAEEIRSTNLDLLQVSGVSPVQFVLGKWAAAWATAVVVVAPAGLFVVLLQLWGDPDPGPAVSGFIGLALAASALVAVGVAASAVTSSQAVAATISFFTGMLLWFAAAGNTSVAAGGLLVRISLAERLRSFAGGAVDLSSVGYMVVLTAVSLVLAVVALDSRRLR